MSALPFWGEECAELFCHRKVCCQALSTTTHELYGNFTKFKTIGLVQKVKNRDFSDHGVVYFNTPRHASTC